MKQINLILVCLIIFSCNNPARLSKEQFFEKLQSKLSNEYKKGEYTLYRTTSNLTDSNSISKFSYYSKVKYETMFDDSINPFIYEIQIKNNYKACDGVYLVDIDSTKRIIHYGNIIDQKKINWKNKNQVENFELLKFIVDSENELKKFFDNREWDKIYFKADTVYKERKCYYIKCNVTDTDYTRKIIYGPFCKEIFFDYTTLLPFRFTDYQELFGNKTLFEYDITDLKKEESGRLKIDFEKFKSINKEYNLINYENQNTENGHKVYVSKEGQIMPFWKGINTRGIEVNSMQLKGKIYIIDFSYKTCYYCIKSIPMLNYLKKKYPKIDIFWLDPFDSPNKSFENFSKVNKIGFEVLFNCEKAKEDIKIDEYPHLFIIDKKGMIQSDFLGYNSSYEKQIDSILSVIYH